MESKKARFSRKILLFLLGITIPLILIVLFFTLPSSQKKEAVPNAPTQKPVPTAVISLPPEGTYIPDQLIIKFKPGQSPDETSDKTLLEEIQRADLAAGMLQKSKLFDSKTGPLSLYYVILLKKDSDLQKAVRIYQDLPEVAQVQVNGIVKTQ